MTKLPPRCPPGLHADLELLLSGPFTARPQDVWNLVRSEIEAHGDRDWSDAEWPELRPEMDQ